MMTMTTRARRQHKSVDQLNVLGPADGWMMMGIVEKGVEMGIGMGLGMGYGERFERQSRGKLHGWLAGGEAMLDCLWLALGADSLEQLYVRASVIACTAVLLPNPPT